MKKLQLTEIQTNELRRAHRSAKDKRDADRIKAVYLLSRGKTPREIAEVLMLEELLKNKSEYDAHYYLDGVHPQHNTQLAYGWIKKGQDKIVKSNSGRQRININGALKSCAFLKTLPNTMQS